MAFNAANLELVGLVSTPSNGNKRVFHYTTTDSKSAVKATSYWQADQTDFRSLLYFSQDDMLEITADDGTLLATIGQMTLFQGPGPTFTAMLGMNFHAEDIATFTHSSFLP